MSSDPVVRRATPEDEESLWNLFRILHAENGAFSLSEAKVQYLLDRVLHPELIHPADMGVRGYCGVLGPVGKVEAFILLIVGTYWYSEELMLEELANFVAPEHRKGTKHAETLLKYAKHLSDSLQTPLMIGVISNIKTEAKVRLYKRHFPIAGAFFLWNRATGTVSNGHDSREV